MKNRESVPARKPSPIATSHSSTGFVSNEYASEFESAANTEAHEVEAELGNVTQETYFGAEVIENVYQNTTISGQRNIPAIQKFTSENISVDQSDHIGLDSPDSSFVSTRSRQRVNTTQIGSNSRPKVQERYDAIATYANICALSMVGCIIRIGLERGMGSYGLSIESSSGVIFEAFIANMVGSFFLGLLVGSRLKGTQGMLPVYVGLSTGFCGSTTTFSKFNQQVSLMIIGEAGAEGNQFFTGFLSILLGLSAPISSFAFGHDVSVILGRSTKPQKTSRSSDRILATSKAINYVLCGLFCISWITLLVISIVYRDQYVVISTCISVVFAPFGAVLRFVLSKLNQRQYKFTAMNMVKIGTLAANLIGSLILAAIHVIQTWVTFSCPWTAVLHAIGTGFCACLTTVSTLMSEIQALRNKGDLIYSHFYPFCTLFLSLSLSTLINGVSLAVYSGTSSSGNTTCT